MFKAGEIYDRKLMMKEILKFHLFESSIKHFYNHLHHLNAIKEISSLKIIPP
jgi:hypothetical protein